MDLISRETKIEFDKIDVRWITLTTSPTALNFLPKNDKIIIYLTLVIILLKPK